MLLGHLLRLTSGLQLNPAPKSFELQRPSSTLSLRWSRVCQLPPLTNASASLQRRVLTDSSSLIASGPIETHEFKYKRIWQPSSLCTCSKGTSFVAPSHCHSYSAQLTARTSPPRETVSSPRLQRGMPHSTTRTPRVFQCSDEASNTCTAVKICAHRDCYSLTVAKANLARTELALSWICFCGCISLRASWW